MNQQKRQYFGAKFRVFDSEGVGLNHKAEKLHNLCYTEDGESFKFTTDYSEMRKWLLEPNVFWVGHHAVGHDMPAINKVLGLELEYGQFVDTLGLSWFLEPSRKKHGLESYGLEFGFEKVVVEEHEWAEGDYDKMKKRVERDVLINWKLWEKQRTRLESIYG